MILIILAYFIGAIPFSYIIPRLLYGLDIRKEGSGNAGATNVLRSAGIKAALLAALGDVLKGVIPTLIAIFYFTDIAAFVGLSAIFGHCYSPFLKFKGGKGIATTAGAFLVLSPWSVVILVVFQVVMIKITGYMGLSSILSASLLPFTVYYLTDNTNTFYVSIFIGLFIIFKHRTNIVRMLNKTEPKFKLKK